MAGEPKPQIQRPPAWPAGKMAYKLGQVNFAKAKPLGPWCTTGTCLTPDDESDGAAFVDKRSGPTHDEEWRFDLLGPGDQELTSAALGPDGSLTVGGYFTQSLTIAPESATVADSRPWPARSDRATNRGRICRTILREPRSSLGAHLSKRGCRDDRS